MSTPVGHSELRLVEECVGVGEIAVAGRAFPEVRYEVRRFQAMTASGLPVPGLHKIEGRVDLGGLAKRQELIDSNCTLRLEDGRTLHVTLIDAEGRLLAEGHGPSRCTCC